MDYSKLPNPYDFANPVNDPRLFAGRVSELDEIRYYLDHTKRAPRAINLAIIGGRASGKTSILNMIEYEAKKREFCVIRIELDESDAETQLLFFYKLFDAVITNTCIDGAFGGIHSKTYDTYRDMVDAYSIPEDKTFCSFIFPVQYAKAMNAGNIRINLSDTAFKRDIALIHDTLKKPIIILMDECDVLGKSRVHIEKLRNIFMNTQGFMLVLTGTEALFPLINDVFSPIIRQFKKINVLPFRDVKETKDCILKPIESIGIEPLEIVDFETIHDLSGGNPYEIQLICHFLFRRMQLGRSNTMELSIDVLDDVLSELKTLQDTSVRPSINIIRGLDKDQLSAIRALCKSNERATFEQMWFIEYLIYATKNWTKEKLYEHLQFFEQKGLISLHNQKIKFAGDDFDKIYCKYYSRKHGIHLNISEIPHEILFGIMLGIYITDRLECLELTPLFDADALDTDIQETINTFMLEEDKEGKPFKNPFDCYPLIAKLIYETNFEFMNYDSFQILALNLITPWYKLRRWFTFKRKNDCTYELCVKDLNNALSDIRNRARELTSNLEYQIYILPVLSTDILSSKVILSRNEEIKRELCNFHLTEMSHIYLKERDRKKAYFHGKIAWSYNKKPDDSSDANNLGYVFMANEDIDLAHQLLLIAIEKSSGSTESALAKYNLGILTAKRSDWTKANEIFEEARSEAEILKEKDQKCACLFVPRIENEVVKFLEVYDPNLIETINEAISTIIVVLKGTKDIVG